MNYSKHCNLCKYQKTSLATGLTCGVTNEKPNFDKTCSNIALSKEFEEQLEELNLNIKLIKRDSKATNTKFYISILVGFALISCGYTIIIEGFSGLYMYYMVYFLMSLGMVFIGIGYKQLNNHRRILKNALEDKYNLDEILTIYNIKYKSELTFGEKRHGIQEVIIETALNHRTTKRIRTIHRINDQHLR